MKCLDQEFDALCEKGELSSIFFYNRIDKIKVMLKADIKQIPSVTKQDHYSVYSELGGRYLYNFTPETCPKPVKPVEVIANDLVGMLS